MLPQMTRVHIWVKQRQGSKITADWTLDDLAKLEKFITKQSTSKKKPGITLTLKGIWSVKDLESLGVKVELWVWPYTQVTFTKGYQPAKIMRKETVPSLTKARVPYPITDAHSSIQIDLKRRTVGEGTNVGCKLLGTQTVWSRNYQDMQGLDAVLIHFSRFLSFLQNFGETLPEACVIEVNDVTAWSVLNLELRTGYYLTERRRRRIVTQLRKLGAVNLEFRYTCKYE
jgi:hypothetical protein